MTTFTREDFEHAARAIGGLLHWDNVGEPNLSPRLIGRGIWSPPLNDGDALRLAVKLRLGVLTNVNNAAHVAERCLGTCEIHQVNFGKAGDEFAAARHAIFRAAIAIGRAMPAPEVRPTEAPGLPPPAKTATDQQLETLKTDQPTTTPHD